MDACMRICMHTYLLADCGGAVGCGWQFLMEKILRQKIQGDAYWKEFCFALTAETVVDRAMELDHIGGTFGGSRKPTAFIQLVLKVSLLLCFLHTAATS